MFFSATINSNMQILTKKQVKYCRIVTKKDAVLDYRLGVSFQDKLFVSEKFFAGDRQQQAIEYCQTKYLVEGGKGSCLLLANVAGLTVWQEDKAARIVGKKSPEDFVANLELDSLTMQMQNIIDSIEESQPDSQIDRLIDRLKISVREIIGLKQKVKNGDWFSIETVKPFDNNYLKMQFD